MHDYFRRAEQGYRLVLNAAARAVRFAIHRDARQLDAWQVECLHRLEAAGAIAVATLPTGCTVADVQGLKLDFILSFAASSPPPELIELPRYGVWKFLGGDWVNFRGEPAGFWEVYERRAESGGLLARLQRDPDRVIVLKEAYLRTEAFSAVKNRQQFTEHFVRWPAQICADLVAGRTGGLDGAPRASRSEVRRSPSALQRGRLALQVLTGMWAKGFASLFRHEQWNIGIIDQPVKTFATARAVPPIRWLPPPPRAEFRADPFGIVRDGRPLILYEHYSYHDNLGFIVAVDPDDVSRSERVDIGPEPAVHLSYPFLLEYQGRLFCMPESSAAQEICLYEPSDFPRRWVNAATLIAGRGYVDATLFQHGDRWWLAASNLAKMGANSELHLWHAEGPFGPWAPHVHNPVKVDVRSSRPAGPLFTVDGQLYRPAQDCAAAYGTRVVVNRIVALSEWEFSEEPVSTVDPDAAGPYPNGLHTLSSLGERTLVDGKRVLFVPAEFLRVAKHYAAALFMRIR